MSSVTITNVTKAFGDNIVLREFNEVIGDREFITLLGPSGCGKTTMLRLIAGFERPTSGEIKIGDQLVSGEKAFVAPEKRDVGMVFQSYAVWPHMNVYDNVAYPLKIKRRPRDEIRKKVKRVLETVHLDQYEKRYPNQLSGGQQQRVALARALVAAPRLLLLDEPLSNLDAKLRESMRFEIKEIQTTLGITVVYVTHDQTEAMAMSDRIVVINQGVAQQIGAPTEIYHHPANPFVADFIGKVDFLRGVAENGAIRLTDTGQMLSYDGPLSGNVVAAVRPESVRFVEPGRGQLQGKLISQFFLGDVYDCRVALSDAVALRAIADPYTYGSRQTGETVGIEIHNLNVFADDGHGDSLKILT